MKAAILTELNAPLEVCELVHGEPEFGQVLVRIRQSGICGAQLQEIRGEKGNAKFLPHLLGHEAAGEVLMIGEGVTRVKVDDKVICHWRKASGNEAQPARYFQSAQSYFSTKPASDAALKSSGVIGGGAITTFQEQALISENRLTPVADDVSDDLCALLGCGLSTALGTIENEADLKFGETILIIGCGGLGANLILAAKLRQASWISVRDIADKSKIALAMGAHEFIGSNGAGFYKDGPMATSLTSKGMFDVVIDTTGNAAVIGYGMECLSSGGRFVMVGQPPPGAGIEIPNARSLFDGEGKRIIATQGGGFRPDRDIPRYVALWRAGLLKLDGLITDRLPLDRINEGLNLVRQGKAGRVMITP